MTGQATAPELRSLRLRLAATGFVATYGMVLILLTVVLTSDEQVDGLVSSGPAAPSSEANAPVPVDPDIDRGDRGDTGDDEGVAPGILLTTVLLAPLAAALSWWWSGRAVRPVARSLTLQRHLIEETSHELRTPLSILTTNAEVLLADPEPTVEGYRRGLERSADVAARMGEVVESLLVDARGRARVAERSPADLVRLVRSVVDAHAPLAAEAGLTLDLVTSGPVRARIDRATVERAVSNLIANGLHHGKTGTAVRVDVAEVGDGRCQISVTDHGPGIAPADQAAIFERYWRAPSTVDGPDSSDGSDSPDGPQGSGLGLAIVRQVAMAHGGTVDVESPVADGRGTRLRLTLLS